MKPSADGVRGEGGDSRKTWLERPLRQGSHEKEPESVQQKWESSKGIKEGSDIVRAGLRKTTWPRVEKRGGRKPGGGMLRRLCLLPGEGGVVLWVWLMMSDPAKIPSEQRPEEQGIYWICHCDHR